jgi:ribonuclease BN (tRNA processing enzyme)
MSFLQTGQTTLNAGIAALSMRDPLEGQGGERQTFVLVHNAHTLFCEATFREADADHAERTAHLTTRACAEIAEAAGVARLVPFHFSRRYEKDPAAVYAEIAASCRAVVIPETVVID